MPRNIQIALTEPQAQFAALKCFAPAFVAGYGTGKSYTMGAVAVMDASESSDALIAIYEPSYDYINLVAWPAVEKHLIDNGIVYKYHQTDKTAYVSSGQFGDFIFRSLDRPENIVAYSSYRAHIDELDTLDTEKARIAFAKITARNRQIPKDAVNPFNCVRSYCTPEGFKFMNETWGDNATDKENFQVVHAATESNPWASDEYIANVRRTCATDNHVAAYLYGEFRNMASATVYSNYDRDIHRSYEKIRPRETLYIGCDFNVDNTSATGYVRRGKTWHALFEIVKQVDTPALVDEIRKWALLGHHIVMYPDASGTARSGTNAKISHITLLRQAGFEVRAHPKNPDVVDRVNAFQTGLRAEMIFIDDFACPFTSKCLLEQSYGKDGKPDKKSGKDHQNDATTYPIAYEMPIRKPFFSFKTNFMSRV